MISESLRPRYSAVTPAKSAPTKTHILMMAVMRNGLLIPRPPRKTAVYGMMKTTPVRAGVIIRNTAMRVRRMFWRRNISTQDVVEAMAFSKAKYVLISRTWVLTTSELGASCRNFAKAARAPSSLSLMSSHLGDSGKNKHTANHSERQWNLAHNGNFPSPVVGDVGRPGTYACCQSTSSS